MELYEKITIRKYVDLVHNDSYRGKYFSKGTYNIVASVKADLNAYYPYEEPSNMDSKIQECWDWLCSL